LQSDVTNQPTNHKHHLDFRQHTDCNTVQLFLLVAPLPVPRSKVVFRKSQKKTTSLNIGTDRHKEINVMVEQLVMLRLSILLQTVLCFGNWLEKNKLAIEDKKQVDRCVILVCSF
jgi:hypothetical protein